jgi:hypothetical protein
MFADVRGSNPWPSRLHRRGANRPPHGRCVSAQYRRPATEHEHMSRRRYGAGPQHSASERLRQRSRASSERLVHHSRKALRAGERAREDSKDHRAFLFLLEPRKRADTRLRKCTCTKECYPTAANAVYAVSWVAERCCFIEIIGDTFSQMLIGYVKWPALFRRANA